MKKWFRGREKGFTLIELLAAIPIMAIVGLSIGAVLIQLQRSDRIAEEMMAIRQVQAAGDKVSFDGLQSQEVEWSGDDLTDNWTMDLSWTAEYTDSNGDYNLRVRNVEYRLEDEDGNGQYNLWRHETGEWTIGNDDPIETDTDLLVARFLDANQMTCEWRADAGDGTDTFTFTVVSVVGTKTEQRTYDVTPRPVD